MSQRILDIRKVKVDFATLLEEVGDDASIHISRFTSCFVDELRAAGIQASFKEHLTLLEALDKETDEDVDPADIASGLGHHGDVLLPDAIAQSCDVYFYEAGRLVTPEGLAAEARRRGWMVISLR